MMPAVRSLCAATRLTILLAARSLPAHPLPRRERREPQCVAGPYPPPRRSDRNPATRARSGDPEPAPQTPPRPGREINGAQPVDKRGGALAGDPTGAPVRDPALRVQCAEVAASGDIGSTEGEVDPDGLQHTPADLDLERVVAKEAQVPGAGPGRNAVAHRERSAQRAAGG